MNITLKSISIRDLISGYTNDPNAGVFGYHGNLNIRPPYQREFRYDLKQQQAVIETILKGFPLNIMYWSVAGDGRYEMIDGQQRTLSICEYYQHAFNIVDKDRPVLYFDNLTEKEKRRFLDYELTVYFCEGTDKERLDWFRVINIAGERLLDQELRNAVYVGPFVTDARRYFSKNMCAAYKVGGDYMSGKLEEQAYLETVLRWAARHDGISDSAPIDKYMAIHQQDSNANALWAYYMQIITWVKSTFTVYRREMKGLDWGEMFDTFGSGIYDTGKLEAEISRLMEDDEIMRKAGIYRYVLSGDLRDLSFRTFDKKQKREAYERQHGICPHCGKRFALEEMEADHITPWRDGVLPWLQTARCSAVSAIGEKVANKNLSLSVTAAVHNAEKYGVRAFVQVFRNYSQTSALPVGYKVVNLQKKPIYPLVWADTSTLSPTGASSASSARSSASHC